MTQKKYIKLVFQIEEDADPDEMFQRLLVAFSKTELAAEVLPVRGCISTVGPAGPWHEMMWSWAQGGEAQESPPDSSESP